MRKALIRTAIVGVSVLALASCAVQTSTGEEAGDELTSVRGFDLEDGTIHIGQMTALTGPAAAFASEQVAGQQAFWEHLNEEGGIAGKYPVELITADNQYNPQLAVQEYQKISDSVVMWSGILGDASVEALIPALEQDETLALPSTQSARFAQNPVLAPTFQSYETNVWNALSYLNAEGQIDEDSIVCSMVQADQSGAARVAALELGAEEWGYTVGPKAEFAPTDAAFTAQVQALKAGNCDVVVFGGAGNNTPNLVAAATQLDFAPTIIAEFFATADSFRTSPIAGYLEETFLLTGLAGELDDTSIPGIEVLTELLGETPVTMQHVYGYMQASAAATILEKAVELGDLSGPGIQAAVSEVGDVDYNGLGGPVHFGAPGDRVLPETSSLFAYDADAQYGLKSLVNLYVAPEGVPAQFR